MGHPAELRSDRNVRPLVSLRKWRGNPRGDTVIQRIAALPLAIAPGPANKELSVETFLQDVRVALRGFRRAPAFPLTAIATLALGIGATTAIFSTLSAVLLKPLPYPNPQDLYSLRTALTDGRVTTGLLSGGEIFRLNDSQPSIERAAGFQPGDLTLLADDGTPTHMRVYGVSDGFFELFGLPMTRGRLQPRRLHPLPATARRTTTAGSVAQGRDLHAFVEEPL